MSNESADNLQSWLRERAVNIADHYPEVMRIVFKTVRTNGHRFNRFDDFDMTCDSRAFFVLRCPMSKCIGVNSGIDYSEVIGSMISNRETNRRVKLSCGGYGGYNMTFHCDWFIEAEITIEYRP